MSSERITMFCLAHAGGTASTVYAGWGERLAEIVEVVPLDLPGRGGAISRPATSLGSLVRLFAEVVVEAGTWCAFGHSFGAGLALEVVRAAEGLGRGSLCCFVSGRRPPGGERLRQREEPLSDDELLERVSGWGGVPPEFLSNRGLRSMAVDRLRRDIAFSDRLHQFRGHRPVAADLHVLTGRSDPLARPAQALGWSKYSTGRVTFDEFEGDHFFVTANSFVVPTVAARLKNHIENQGEPV